MIRAASSVRLREYFIPFVSRKVTFVHFHLETLHFSPGIERQPSSSLQVSSECSVISGLIIAIVRYSSSSYVCMSDIAMIRLLTHTCGAARPTHPLSGFFTYFTISFASAVYIEISFIVTGVLFSRRILFVSHVSIWNRFAILYNKKNIHPCIIMRFS